MPELKDLKPVDKFRSLADQMAEQKWNQLFAQLVAFKKENGILPQRKHDPTLIYWFTMQRKKARDGKLTAEQLQLFKKAGINVLGRSQKDRVEF
jgi:hypothetical protein